MAKDKGKILHGNEAKIDKTKKIEGAYITNQVVLSGNKKGKAPITNDLMVEDARKFAEENKK